MQLLLFPVGLISVSRTIPAMQSRRVVSAINWKLCHGEVRVETAVDVKQELFLGVEASLKMKTRVPLLYLSQALML